MHGRRALVAAAAAGLLMSLFAPWYRDSVVARGLTGLKTMTLTRSGWDAFSFTEGLVLVVAVVALVLMAAIPLSAADEGGSRRRWLGALVASLGALAFVVVLIQLATAPGTTRHALDATVVSVRWGLFLALGCGALLAVAGVRLIHVQAPDAVGSARRTRPSRSPRRSRPSDPDRPPRPGRVDRAARPARPDRVPRHGRTPRSDRVAPRADRTLWEEQATGWLDLGD
jgi:hypothetical protein